MLLETLYALAAAATIGGFVLEAAPKLHRLVKRRNAQRKARKGVNEAPERNE